MTFTLIEILAVLVYASAPAIVRNIHSKQDQIKIPAPRKKVFLTLEFVIKKDWK